MTRLHEADLQEGDRLRYYEPEGAHHIGRIVSIERRPKVPAVALFACDDGSQLIIRLGTLAKHSTRVGEMVS